MPSGPVTAALLAVPIVLAGIHLIATGGTGHLGERATSQLAITPATTLSHWWRHFWAGFFHKSWGHLAFNLALFGFAVFMALRNATPWPVLANVLWMGTFAVFTLHLLLVLPLASAGLPYAVKALHVPLVGFSVMAYAALGIALVGTPMATTAAITAGVILLELAGAIWVTSPFVSVYHLGGLGLGYWVRTLLLRY